MYICVDFDGTVVDHRYPDIGEPAPGAITWLKKLQRHGARLILFTMRSDRQEGRTLLRDAVQYLEDNGIKLYGVNHNPDQDDWTSSPKAYGDVYVDDSAFGCPLIKPIGFARPCVDWKVVGPQLEHMCLSRR
jgi:trehalose-6-phosphatase